MDSAAAAEQIMLPENVVPVKYNLDFKTVDLVNFVYSGNMRVTLEVKESTSIVQFHSSELYLHDITLEQNGKTFTPDQISFDQRNDFVTLKFGAPLSVGAAVLTIVFDGQLTDRLRGFYRSKFIFEGKERYFATSDFEPCSARKAIPCWDEPNFKAVFEVTMVIPKKYHGISNSIVTECYAINEAMKFWKFAPTPKMSTYLLAFIVGEFDAVSGYTASGTQVNIYAVAGQGKDGKYALQAAIDALNFYEKFFQIPYPLPKSDHIAIPDFNMGAMENWGAITYRDYGLLLPEAGASVARKQTISVVVAHELAHQWFGNLVTMKWWNDLWLNEGFAEYMEYVCNDANHPNWNFFLRFVLFELMDSLDSDSLVSTHPIVTEAQKPTDIFQMFDTISYSKGSSVIRMMVDYMGLEPFQKGTQLYLNRFKYGNAKTIDLWHALEESSGLPVGSILEEFITKPGFPIVTITEKDGHLVCSQKRYYQNPEEVCDETVWKIPLKATVIQDGKETIVTLPVFDQKVSTADSVFSKALNSLKGTIKLNHHFSSFCHINYTPAQWQSFIPLIEAKHLDPLDRVNVLVDALAILKTGDLSPEVFFSILKAYSTVLSRLYAKEPFYPQFQQMVHELFQGIYDKVGWEERSTDPEPFAKLRPSVLNIFCLLSQDEAAFAKGLEIYYAFVGDQVVNHILCYSFGPSPKAEPIPESMRTLIFTLAVRQSDLSKASEAYDMLLKRMDALKDSGETRYTLSALCSVKHKELILRGFELIFSPSIRLQDVFLPTIYFGRNSAAVGLFWPWFKEHFQVYYDHYKDTSMYLAHCLGDLFDSYTTVDIIAEANAFFADKDTSSFQKSIDSALESVEIRAHRLAREAPILAKYFSK